MDPILEIASRHGLHVVEDTAQAHGAYYKGRRAGSMGIAGCFSFYPGKNLGAFGDGGAVCTNNKDLADKIKFWQNWGAVKKYHHELKGGNSRLDAIQAAVLGVKLKYLDENNSLRRNLADRYTARLSKECPEVKVPSCASDVVHVWHLYVVQVPRRDDLLAFLHKNGVMAGLWVHMYICCTCAHATL
jgi:dTDP-4-amino-4,6-dideoxygalactose transaminase